MAVVAAVEMQGNREFGRALKATGDDVNGSLRELHLEGARIVTDAAVQRVPVRTGRLRDSVRAAGLQTRGEVRAGFKRIPYAGPIHFGHPARGIRPQPFIYEAMDARREEVVDAYHRNVESIARRHGLEVD